MAEGAIDAGMRGLTAPNANGYATPQDGGPPIGPEQAWPQPGHTSFREFLHALNPLQHLPVIGMIYRAITGDEIQPAYRIGGSIISGLITGGPLGAIATVAGCFAEDLFHRMVDGLRAPSEPSVAPGTNAAAAPSVLASSIDPATGASIEGANFTAGVGMRQGIAAYARVQGTALAAIGQPGQDSVYAAYGSG